MDAQKVLDMTVVLLKAKLRELGLPLDGRKKDLRDRLLQHYGLLNDDDEEEDNDYESVLSQREAGVVTRDLSVVDGLDLEVTFHIIRDRDMDYPALLGRAILSQVDLIIREKGDELHQKQSYREKVAETESRIKELSEEFADICMQANEAGANQNGLSHLRKEELIAIERLISEYVPKKSITSPVTMKIVLTDDTPVYQRPRRTSYEDQRVIEKQVESWLDEGIITTSISDFASP